MFHNVQKLVVRQKLLFSFGFSFTKLKVKFNDLSLTELVQIKNPSYKRYLLICVTSINAFVHLSDRNGVHLMARISFLEVGISCELY